MAMTTMGETRAEGGRILLPLEDYVNLVRAEAERDCYQREEKQELQGYRDTGLTPEQIREMDRIFTEKCREVWCLTKERDELKKKLGMATPGSGTEDEG